MRSEPLSADDVDDVERFKNVRSTLEEALGCEEAGDDARTLELVERAEEELNALAEVDVDDLDAEQLEDARLNALRHLKSVPRVG